MGLTDVMMDWNVCNAYPLIPPFSVSQMDLHVFSQYHDTGEVLIFQAGATPDLMFAVVSSLLASL